MLGGLREGDGWWLRMKGDIDNLLHIWPPTWDQARPGKDTTGPATGRPAL